MFDRQDAAVGSVRCVGPAELLCACWCVTPWELLRRRSLLQGRSHAGCALQRVSPRR